MFSTGPIKFFSLFFEVWFLPLQIPNRKSYRSSFFILVQKTSPPLHSEEKKKYHLWLLLPDIKKQRTTEYFRLSNSSAWLFLEQWSTFSLGSRVLRLISSWFGLQEMLQHSPTAPIPHFPGKLQQSLEDSLKDFPAMAIIRSFNPTPNKRTWYMFQAAAEALTLFPANLAPGQSYISNLYIMFSFISCSLWTWTQRQFSLPLEGVNPFPSFPGKGKTVPAKSDTPA